MTNLEALKATVNFPLPEITLQKSIVDQGASPSGTYIIENRRIIDQCASELLFVILTSPENIKEGGYSLTTARYESLKTVYTRLVNKWGLPNELNSDEPTIEGISPW